LNMPRLLPIITIALIGCATANLTEVSYQPDKDRFTLIFSEDAPPEVTPLLFASPWRLVLDVSSAPDSKLAVEKPYDEGAVSSVKVASTSSGNGSRITVSLGRPASFTRKKLKFKGGGSGVTFYLDSSKATGRTPLLAEASPDARVLAFIKPGTKMKMGMVKGDYRYAEAGKLKGWLPRKESKPVSNLRSRIITSAKKRLGKPYIWGGTGPRGYDCSGLVYACYTENGQEIPRGSGQQYHRGKRVKRKDLLPGDLVFFHTTRKGISHVGIWVGDNKFIHASCGRGVVVQKMAGYYAKRLVGARRLP
jgi:cell wall-associated NlpC family hydrolase